jgi:hypothetical protein
MEYGTARWGTQEDIKPYEDTGVQKQCDSDSHGAST